MFIWRQQLTEAALQPAATGAGANDTRIVLDWGFTAASTPEGVSRGDFTGLNLGDHVGDDPAAVAANRASVASALEVPPEHLLFLQQVHGADVVEAAGPWPGAPPAADAVVTRQAHLAVGVLVADCTPVLLADPAQGVVGAVHAGRPGLVKGIVTRAVAAMRDLGARQIRAAVGPSVCGRCYEVPAQMRADVVAVSPVSSAVSWHGTPAVDVSAGVVDQLSQAGVALTWIPGCTRESTRLYSYRRTGRTGRTAGVARLWDR